MYVFTHTSLCTWFRVGFKGLIPSDFLEVLRPFCYLSIHLSSSRQKYKIRCIRSYHYHHISLLPSYIMKLIINDFSPFAVAVPAISMLLVRCAGWAYEDGLIVSSDQIALKPELQFLIRNVIPTIPKKKQFGTTPGKITLDIKSRRCHYFQTDHSFRWICKDLAAAQNRNIIGWQEDNKSNYVYIHIGSYRCVWRFPKTGCPESSKLDNNLCIERPCNIVLHDII